MKSVVTSPAVPLPTDFTAAALALSAAAPVTVVSASSCAAVPCAGKLEGIAWPAAGVVAVDDEVDGVVAALASAAPPTAAPPMAAPATSLVLSFLILSP